MEVIWNTGGDSKGRASTLETLERVLEKKNTTDELYDLPMEVKGHYHFSTVRVRRGEDIKEKLHDQQKYLKTIVDPVVLKIFWDGSKMWLSYRNGIVYIVVMVFI